MKSREERQWESTLSLELLFQVIRNLHIACVNWDYFFCYLEEKASYWYFSKFLSPLAQNCPLRSRPSTLDHFHQYKTGWNSSCMNRKYLDCSSQFPLGELLESDVCIPCLYFQIHSLLLLVQSISSLCLLPHLLIPQLSKTPLDTPSFLKYFFHMHPGHQSFAFPPASQSLPILVSFAGLAACW